MKVKIKSFNGSLPEYLTEGKEYDVIKCGTYWCDIVDDDGDDVFILLDGCEFLNGGSWEVVSERS